MISPSVRGYLEELIELTRVVIAEGEEVVISGRVSYWLGENLTDSLNILELKL